MMTDWIKRVEVIVDRKPWREQSERVQNGLLDLNSIFEQALDGAKRADRSNKNCDVAKRFTWKDWRKLL